MAISAIPFLFVCNFVDHAPCRSPLPCRKLDKEHSIVGLNARLVGRTVSLDLSTLRAFMYDNESLLGIRLCEDRLHLSLAGIVAIPWINVDVE